VPLLRLRYKVVGTSHGFAYKREKWGGFAKRFFRWSEKLMFSLSTTMTCVSKPLTHELTSHYNRDVKFIPNGIDRPETLEDPVMFDKYELRESEYICFAAGRVDPTKGCHILLQAIRGIDRDVRVIAIGDFGHKKDYTDELHEMADERVTFIPFIAKKELLFGIVNNAKVFVFPSTVEAMSIMLLEVAALGVPVVCSDIPENTTVLEDRTTYFRSGDSDDLREKLELCLDSYDDAVSQAQATMAWVLETYNWKSIAGQYKKLFDELA
jgi:glycosyltransferase involved in cell wall biosynthesis